MAFEVFYHELTADDTVNKYMVLNGTPLSADNVALDSISGTAQQLLGDFAMDGSKVTWGGLNLDGVLDTGDVIRVIYDRS